MGVPDVPVRELVSAMKPRTRKRGPCMDDPFAITSSGVVLLNVQNFDDVATAEDALRRALREPGPIFIGVPMTVPEVRLVLEHLRDVVHEPAGFVIGRRQRRRT